MSTECISNVIRHNKYKQHLEVVKFCVFISWKVCYNNNRSGPNGVTRKGSSSEEKLTAIIITKTVYYSCFWWRRNATNNKTRNMDVLTLRAVVMPMLRINIGENGRRLEMCGKTIGFLSHRDVNNIVSPDSVASLYNYIPYRSIRTRPWRGKWRKWKLPLFFHAASCHAWDHANVRVHVHRYCALLMTVTGFRFVPDDLYAFHDWRRQGAGDPKE